MPKLSPSAIPSYRLHRASGQAVVTLNHREHYLGKWDAPESRAEYDRLIAEWITAGRQAPAVESDLTITEATVRYWKFVEQHYRKDGKPTHEQDNIRCALRPVIRLYGHTPINTFGPKSLKALQVHMVDAGLCRPVVNQRIGKVKRFFKWAVSEELAPPSLYHALATVAGLQAGRTAAREPEPVLPVPEDDLERTLSYLPPVVRAMVQFQRLTGCRPGEATALRPMDLDRSGDVWRYVVPGHKMAHRGRERVVFIGPKAQALLARYLLRQDSAYCFSPADSERTRKAALRERRKTRVQPSQRDRSKKNARRKPGARYTKDSYLWAVYRACDRAGIDRWSPNRLRHSAATELRKNYGLEASQAVLGHSDPKTTLRYAEANLERAAEIMRKIG